MQIKVTMPYIGRALSVNSYRVSYGRRLTTKIKPEVKAWMSTLASRVKEKTLFPEDLAISKERPLTIKLFGKFVDERVPDLSNLHKVISDAVMEGLGVDDKNFRLIDLGYSTGWVRPVLELELTTE